MDKQPENNTTPAQKADDCHPASPDAKQEQSWGDKYKHKALHFGRNVGLNFIINFGISALGTYAVIKSPANKILQKGVDKIAAGAMKIGAKKELADFLGEFLVRTQLLLIGGHILVPPLKAIHDHRKHLEFEIGHKLDVMQSALGRGNEATRQNLKDYKYIKDLREAKPAALSDDDRELLKKHCIDDNMQFKEKPETWKHVLKARGLGVASTTSLSAVFAVLSYFGKDKTAMGGKDLRWMNVKETWLKGTGAKYGEKWLAKPLRKIGIEDSKTLGELVVLELLYTFASKLGFDHMEHRMIKKQEAEEAKLAAAKLQRDREAADRDAAHGDHTHTDHTHASQHQHTKTHAVPSALEARRKIVDEGMKDFRARETARPAEQPGMAVS